MKKLITAIAIFIVFLFALNIYAEYKKPPQQRAAELEQTHAQMVKQR
jgi:hypothetical protein